MEIRLNGQPRSVGYDTLAELLAAQDIDPAKPGVAVAVNDSIVPRAAWRTAPLRAGDAVEIVRPHSGG